MAHKDTGVLSPQPLVSLLGLHQLQLYLFCQFATLFCVCHDVKRSWEALLYIDSIHYVIDSHPPLHETDTVSNQPPLLTISQMSKLSPGAQTSGPRACGQAQICTLALPLTLPSVQPTPSLVCAASLRMAQADHLV